MCYKKNLTHLLSVLYETHSVYKLMSVVYVILKPFSTHTYTHTAAQLTQTQTSYKAILGR